MFPGEPVWEALLGMRHDSLELTMDKPTSILAIAGCRATDSDLVSKATRLARRWGARLELFLCDADHAYALEHAYEPSGVEEARRACMTQAKEYLVQLKNSAGAQDIQISTDAVCESPLYEGIVHKVLKSRPDFVMKNAGGEDPLCRSTFDANDWQLMRTCPVTLMMTRGKTWPARPRFAAAVDVTEQETAGLAKTILQTAEGLMLTTGGDLEILYAKRAGVAADTGTAQEAALTELARQSHVEAAHVHILAGNPEQALPASTRERDYDVLVLGALSHRKGIALVGTLTSKLVEVLDCDFVLVKPDTYRCPVE